MGGESLFIMQSYKAVLKRLNDQIGSPDVVLQETRRKLLSLQAVHQHSPTQVINQLNKILQSIDEIETMGDVGQLQDPSMINHVVSLLPYAFRKKWFKTAANKKEEKVTPSLKHLATLIKEQLPSVYEESLYVAKKVTNTKVGNAQHQKAERNPPKVYTHQEQPATTNKVYCWYHENGENSVEFKKKKQKTQKKQKRKFS
jgi:hypothetical protein